MTPVVVLGGAANAVSVARSLGRAGAAVHVLCDPGAYVRHSRFCRPIDVPGGAAAWADFLLGADAEHLRGAVLLSCSDAGIELIVAHREALAARYRLDDSNPAAQLAMLDKLATYQAAVAAGVPTPKFWVVADDLDGAVDAAEFPLIVKPRRSHVFEGQTGRKLFVVHDRDALAAAVAAIARTGTESLVVEMIPGPDSLLCSYFTYLDEHSRTLFHFTKRIVRRYPALRGTACSHVTDHVPEAAELGARLFRHVGLRGLANVEFKLDQRDGQLKLIECNARFTASNALVARSGIDLALFVYNRLTGRPLPPTDRFEVGKRMWDPVRDFQAFRVLNSAGEMRFSQWLADVCHRQSFPYFEWSDPMPALVRLCRPVTKRLGKARRRGRPRTDRRVRRKESDPMPNVLIMPTPLRHRPGRYREVLRAAGFTPVDPPGRHRLSESDLIAALSDVDALLAGGDPVTARMIRSAPRLRAIARTGVGYESVDLAAASERRIPVAITPGANHESVAEHALALILALTRDLLGNDRMVRDGGWERRPVRPLRGTTLGIVGLGRIGRALATRARALGMDVLAFDRNADPDFDAAHGIRRLSFDAVLSGADVVSICLPLSAATQGLFDRRAFARMRPGSILVNTARGGLVVEADLYEALASGRLAGAGLDVLAAEPPARDNPLLNLSNVVFSPHIAGVDAAALDDMAEHAARIVVDLYRGRWPEGCVVNEEVRPSWRW